MANVIDDVVEVPSDDKEGPWSLKKESIFIGLMYEEVLKQNIMTTTFSRDSWKYIREQLKLRTGYAYSQEQIKNKFNLLRRLYRDFKKLLRETGVSWDSGSGTVTAEEQLWKKLYKVNNHARQFKKKGFPHYEKLCRIFGDTIATGENAHPSTKLPLESEDEDFLYNSKVDGNDDNADDTLMAIDRHRSRSTTPKGSSCGKRESYDAALIAVLSSFAESSKRRTDMMEKRMMNPTLFVESCGDSVCEKLSDQGLVLLRKCMAALNALEDIDGVTYTKAVKLLHDDPLWRVIFVDMPDNRKRDLVLNL